MMSQQAGAMKSPHGSLSTFKLSMRRLGLNHGAARFRAARARIYDQNSAVVRTQMPIIAAGNDREVFVALKRLLDVLTSGGGLAKVLNASVQGEGGSAEGIQLLMSKMNSANADIRCYARHCVSLVTADLRDDADIEALLQVSPDCIETLMDTVLDPQDRLCGESRDVIPVATAVSHLLVHPVHCETLANFGLFPFISELKKANYNNEFVACLESVLKYGGKYSKAASRKLEWTVYLADLTASFDKNDKERLKLDAVLSLMGAS